MTYILRLNVFNVITSCSLCLEREQNNKREAHTWSDEKRENGYYMTPPIISKGLLSAG